MQSRLKTFSEFLAKKKIIYRDDCTGIIITCMNNVLIKTTIRPWNTPATKNTFLAKIYIEQVLKKKSLPDNIMRIPGFELLGKRCTFKNQTIIICSTNEVVDTQTGEVIIKATVVSATNEFRTQPFIINLNEIYGT